MKRVVSLAFLGLFLLACTVALAAPVNCTSVTGAIFTTNADCSGVDLNIYTDRLAVYINGGPAHPGAAGLPDGSYCVQVTDPSTGTILGTSAPGAVTVVGGVFVQCYQLWAILTKASDGTQGYDITPNPGGEYKVTVSTDCTFANPCSKTDNFKVNINCTVDATDPSCGDFCTLHPDDPACRSHIPQAEIIATKYYDANANGVFDAGDTAITGWKICVQELLSLPDCNHTSPVDIFVTPDTYTVTEGTPVEPNWVHTGCADVLNGAPATGCANGSLTSDTFTLQDQDVKTLSFGNVCLGAGGGLTLGFWSNRNGQAILNADPGYLAFLDALNLRNADGTNFDPTTYTQFRTWLLNATATNMAYMLSAQLATMELNVREGKVSGSALVYAPCLIGTSTPGVNSLGFISINDLMAAANTSLGADGLTLAGNPDRAYQECLKTALDNANNNLNFVQSAPCPFSF